MQFKLKRFMPAAILCILFAFLDIRFDGVRHAELNLMFRMRGPLHPGHEILFVTVNEADLRALGGFPLSRDYYGYLVHILTDRGAGTIGIDVLFDRSNARYPEHDRILSDFIESSGRVVLPCVMTDSKTGTRLEPVPYLRQHAAGTGFSNLGDQSVLYQTPIRMGGALSFGAALASHFLNDSTLAFFQSDHLTINHIGSVNAFAHIGLTDLFHRFESAPDSLDFMGKLVIFGLVAPSLPVLKATPFGAGIPASMIHGTVAENLIRRNWIRMLPFWSRLLILAGMGFGGIFAASRSLWKQRVIFAACLCFGYKAMVVIAFHMCFLLPFMLPICLFALSCGLFAWQAHHQTFAREKNMRVLLEEQIRVKRRDLQEAEALLTEAIREKEALSGSQQKLADEKRAAVIQLEKHLRDLQAAAQPEMRPAGRFQAIIHAADSPMAAILDLVQKVARDDIPVLIYGETGTGKELVARAIHDASHRQRNPFIAMNCGALSETLLESELFGHERGAFTGATGKRRGRFELADGGTMFLDEISETSPAFQARLLRVLQEGAFERVGGERTLHVNIRIVAAHNRDIEAEVRNGRFREDLFFRLNGFPIRLPPLRERKIDIPMLVHHFIEKYESRPVRSISESALELCRAYAWPGNVRELENAIRRAALLTKSEGKSMIRIKDLPDGFRGKRDGRPAAHAGYQPLEEQMLALLRQQAFSRSSIRETARALGYKDRSTITEHFRGLCFEAFVQNNFNEEAASRALADSVDTEVIGRVFKKLHAYLENVQSSIQQAEVGDMPSCFKGLPKKYHAALEKAIAFFQETNRPV